MASELLNQATGNTDVALAIAAAAIGARLFVAGVFLFGAAHKFSTRLEFSGIVGQYRLLPRGAESIVAPIVIGVELVAALALLFAPTTGAVIAMLLLAGYAMAIAINIGRGRAHIDCGCGGESTPLSPALVGRNLLMVVLLIAVPLAQRNSWNGQYTDLLGIVFALGLGALYLGYNQLQANAGIYRRLWLGEEVG